MSAEGRRDLGFEMNISEWNENSLELQGARELAKCGSMRTGHGCSGFYSAVRCAQNVGRAPGGRRWSSGGARGDCMRYIFILNEIWLQGKVCISVST
jgi:hypothetical protein